MSLSGLFLLPVLATAPYALVETRDIRATDIQSFKIYVRAVDGKAYWDGPDEMKLTPGVHWIVMARDKSATKARNRKNGEQSLYILAKPCMRYSVAGKAIDGSNYNDSPNFNQKWSVHVLKEERISYCKTQEEQDQAKKEKKAAKKAAKAEKLSESEAIPSDVPKSSVEK